jgi:hypothetical protein
LGTEDERQWTRSDTWKSGWDTRNRDVRQGTKGGKQGTEKWDREQRTGDKEQRSDKWNRGRETRNKEVRQGIEDGIKGTETWDREQGMGIDTWDRRQGTGKGDSGMDDRVKTWFNTNKTIKMNFRVCSANE